MLSAIRRPWPIAAVTDRSPVDDVAAGEDARRPRSASRPSVSTVPSRDADSRCRVPSSERSVSWPSARTSESAASRSVRPVGCGKPLSSSSICSISEPVGVDPVDGGEPVELDALLLGLGHLVVVGRHPVAGAPVDDDRVGGAQPLGGPGRVDGGVAAAVHRDPAAQQRALPLLEAVQQRDGVDHCARRGRRAGRCGVPSWAPTARTTASQPSLADSLQVGDRGVELEPDAEARSRATSASSTSRGSR